MSLIPDYEDMLRTDEDSLQDGHRRAKENTEADEKRMSESYNMQEENLIPDYETKKMRIYLKNQLPSDAILDAYGTEKEQDEKISKSLDSAQKFVDEDMAKMQAELDDFVSNSSEYESFNPNNPIFVDKGAPPSKAEVEGAMQECADKEKLLESISALTALYNKLKSIKKDSYVETRKNINKRPAYLFSCLDSAEEAIKFIRGIIDRPVYEPVEGYEITEQELIDSEKEYLSTDPGIYHRKYNKQDSNDLSLYLDEVAANITEEEMLDSSNYTPCGNAENYELRNFNKWSESKEPKFKPWEHMEDEGYEGEEVY